jgi:hypothetical protein
MKERRRVQIRCRDMQAKAPLERCTPNDLVPEFQSLAVKKTKLAKKRWEKLEGRTKR